VLVATTAGMDRPKSHHLIMRAITPLAVWAVTKLLDTPRVKDKLQEADARTFIAKRGATRSLQRLGRNAANNRAWLAGGAAAIALGIGMIGRAARPK
jgi:hypothetical protein